jgi:hypothetical protein
MPRINAVHLGRTASAAAKVPFSKPPPGDAPLRTFDRIALVEALDREAATQVLAALKNRLMLDKLPADFGSDVYDLAFVFPGADPGERLRHRRPAWDASAA